MSLILIAKVCHETNKAFCEAIGDNSQKSWDEAPAWQRASAMAGVLGYIEGRITSPEDAHKDWLAEKLKDGWSYGFVKSEDCKEHPCMVAYDELPKEQKAKDAIFYAIVKTMVDSGEYADE